MRVEVIERHRVNSIIAIRLELRGCLCFSNRLLGAAQLPVAPGQVQVKVTRVGSRVIRGSLKKHVTGSGIRLGSDQLIALNAQLVDRALDLVALDCLARPGGTRWGKGQSH